MAGEKGPHSFDRVSPLNEVVEVAERTRHTTLFGETVPTEMRRPRRCVESEQAKELAQIGFERFMLESSDTRVGLDPFFVIASHGNRPRLESVKPTRHRRSGDARSRHHATASSPALQYNYLYQLVTL